MFDEDYVQDHVRLQEDGLQTIVILGEKAELQGKIDLAIIECDAAKNTYDARMAVCSRSC